jgi:cytochrome b561
MASGPERRNAAAVAIYWICLALGVGALGLGWSLTFAPLDPPTRDYLKDLHISMGLMAAIALTAQFLLSIALFAVRATQEQRKLRDWIAWALRQLVYLSLVATILTGFLDAVFRGQQLYFWGIPLPLWDANGLSTSEQFQIAHRMAAYALAGSILASLAVAIVYVFVAPTTSEAVRLAAAPHPSATSVVKVIADSLAQSFRFFGRFAFWVQFLLGFLSAAMLALSFMGHTVTPDSTAFGDAIYWASAALLLIIVSVMISSSYSKTAKKIAAGSGRGLSMDRRTAFWFLGPAAFVSAVGVVISFVGVGLSVALLIGKTVSQPPGIAITNPTKIVRALDVFVLMVNFNLLFAHFIGFAIAAWLSVSTLKAIHQYVIASQGAKPE